MRTRIPYVAGLVLAAMAFAACGSTTTESPAEDETTVEEPAVEEPAVEEPAVEDPATEEPAVEEPVVEEPMGLVIAETPIVGVLGPYNPEGETLFADGTVEAHWYQWDGEYVVLYRDFDASSGQEICPGNSAFDGAAFGSVSNSPHGGAADNICPGAGNVVKGLVQACGPLLYYLTQIPTSAEGSLYGSMEIGDSNGFRGHTSEAAIDLASTPEFEPGLTAYALPASTMDDLVSVTCG